VSDIDDKTTIIISAPSWSSVTATKVDKTMTASFRPVSSLLLVRVIHKFLPLFTQKSCHVNLLLLL